MKTKRLLLIGILIFVLAIVQTKAQDKLQEGIDLFENNKFEAAKSFFEKVIDQDEKNDRAQYYLGRSYFAFGDFSAAADCFTEAVDLNDKNADYHFWLGNAFGLKIRNANIFKKAVLASKIKSQFLKTVELDPNHIDGRIGIIQYYMRAPGIMGGSINKAIEHAKILVKLEDKKGRLLLATLYTQQKKLKEAENEYKILESTYGNDKEFFYFFNTYGYFLVNQKRYDEAIVKFRKQVELAPLDANAHDSLGEALLNTGKNDEAAVEYRTALKLSPNFKASQENLRKAEENIKKKAVN